MLLSALVIGAVSSVVACNKDDDNKPTTPAKIQAKWKVASIVIKAGDGDSTYTGTAADYADFRTDGKVYTSYAGAKDTALYTVVNDTKMVIDGDTADIKQLSDSQFVFTSSDIVAANTLTTTFSLTK